MILQPCIECGVLGEANRCPAHRLPAHPKARRGDHPASRNRHKWRRFSKRLRKLSPFCEFCGATEDLTVDHIVRVTDRPDWTYEPDNCRILCRTCNGKISDQPASCELEQVIGNKIAARRGGMTQAQTEFAPAAKAFFPSHITDSRGGVGCGD